MAAVRTPPGACIPSNCWTCWTSPVPRLARCSPGLEEHCLAFAPLQDWAPQLQRMIDLRNTLGLRSPIHSLARVLNPLGARCGLQSIFHPGYQAVHREASRLLGDHAVVIKGDGGEIEVNPDVISHLYGTTAGAAWDEEWPALSAQRHVKPATLQPEHLLKVWRGEAEDSYGELAVLATLAMALRGLGQSHEQAFETARNYWTQRKTSNKSIRSPQSLRYLFEQSCLD